MVLTDQEKRSSKVDNGIFKITKLIYDHLFLKINVLRREWVVCGKCRPRLSERIVQRCVIV